MPVYGGSRDSEPNFSLGRLFPDLPFDLGDNDFCFLHFVCISLCGVYVCMYACLYACVYEKVCIHMCAYRGQRLTSGIFFDCSLPSMLRQDLLPEPRAD